MDEPLYKNRDWLYQKIVVENKSHAKAAEEIGCSRSAVATWASKYEIRRERIWERLLRESGEEIGRLYTQEDYTLKALAEMFDCAESVIRKALSELEIPLRTMSEVKIVRDKTYNYRKHSLNEDYFKTWSSEMAYILGFIAADGCIFTSTGKKTKYLLKINLQESDFGHLVKIKDALGYGGEVKVSKIKSRGINYAHLDVNSKTLISDIKEIGIRERKSLDKEMPVSLPKEYEIDYIRGYFDGNGTVGMQYPTNSKGLRAKTGQIRVRIASGSKINLAQMQEILVRHGLEPKRVASGEGNIHEICYSTRESLVLFDLFYKDEDSMRLDRKYEDFKKYAQQRKEDISRSEGHIKVKTKNNNEMEND